MPKSKIILSRKKSRDEMQLHFGQRFLTFSAPGPLFLKILAWGPLVHVYTISQSGGRRCLHLED